MKQTPLKHYRVPEYPELNRENEAAVKLLLKKRMPARWKRLAASAAMLCASAGLMEGCLSKSAGKASTEQGEVKPKPPGGIFERKPKNTVTVAPLAPEIFTHPRGGFGCVAVTMPVYLGEDEAKEIIFEELAKAGIHLQPKLVLTRKPNPPLEPSPDGIYHVVSGMADREKAFALPDFRQGLGFVNKPLSFELDWFDSERGVAVEWMTPWDERFWNNVAQFLEDPAAQPVMSSFRVHDYGKSAPAFAKVIPTFTSKHPVKVGLFAPSFIYLTEEESKVTGAFYKVYYSKLNEAAPYPVRAGDEVSQWQEYRDALEARAEKVSAFEKANKAVLDEARRKRHAYLTQIGKTGEPELRAQVRHFVKWLEEQEKTQ